MKECGWERLRDCLSDLPTDCEYYRRDGWLDYVGLDDDDDFDNHKEQTRDEAEEYGVFDDDNEDDEDYEYDADEPYTEDDSDCEFAPFDGVSVVTASYAAFEDEQERLKQARSEREAKAALMRESFARHREQERQKELIECARHVKEMSGLLDTILYGAAV